MKKLKSNLVFEQLAFLKTLVRREQFYKKEEAIRDSNNLRTCIVLEYQGKDST